MSTNEKFLKGDNISLPVTAGTLAGSPVVVGSLIGVALTDAATTTKFGGGNPVDSASVQTRGVFNLSVTGVTAPGTPIYITSGYALNVTASGNTLFGYALDTKTSGAAVIRVKLAQV